MKTGVIVYVTGEPPSEWVDGEKEETRRLDPSADRISVITSTTGHFDLHDAWFDLTTKGMALIICKMARFNEAGQIQLTGRELRLCG